ncbi:lipopolysaccharide core heptose(II) kinase RfaY [Superficieibacter sp.]|uniref:lipopolysaccharide core heptose(II) kinase RfaY n=1 Tax=Superficieibacter sp. TaxID=2303322 RepID=UPI0028AF6146|nr:lipopolysaccharide core heptose(II) kinase RfaY [Superficieibacter sp.]
MSIVTSKENGFNIYEKSTGVRFGEVLKQYLAGELKATPLGSGNEDRTVALVEYEGQKYILKNDREKDKRLEKRVQSYLSGPFFSRLIYAIDRAIRNGYTGTADLYYVAEKMVGRECVDVYTLHEYVEGTPLKAIDDSNRDDVARCIVALHGAGLASNDIHAGNFIRTPEGDLKIIDLSCRGSMRVCQANDLLTLRKKYHIVVQGHGAVYRLITLKEDFRRLSRRLRGKAK